MFIVLGLVIMVSISALLLMMSLNTPKQSNAEVTASPALAERKLNTRKR